MGWKQRFWVVFRGFVGGCGGVLAVKVPFWGRKQWFLWGFWGAFPHGKWGYPDHGASDQNRGPLFYICYKGLDRATCSGKRNLRLRKSVGGPVSRRKSRNNSHSDVLRIRYPLRLFPSLFSVWVSRTKQGQD